ncbi:MAG: hypothetical protein V4603_15305 [Pseudomonadota bacterium]
MKTLNKINLLLVIAGWMLTHLRVDAAEASLLAFELEATDGTSYTERSWAGKPLVLLVASSEGVANNAGQVWSRPLHDFFTAHAADVVGVADVPGVPRLFRGAARNMAAPDDDDAVRTLLMDWDGEFMPRYGLSRGAYNVLVFDRAGKLVYTVALRTFSQAQLDGMLRDLQPIVDAF